LTESEAILRYIANTWNPDLLGKTTADKSKVDMLIGVFKDLKSGITSGCYTAGTTKDDLKTKVLEGKCSEVSAYLSDHKFLVADYTTLPDILLWEILDMFNWISDNEITKKYPNLGEFHDRISAKFADYLKGDKFIAAPFNAPFAVVNNI